MENGQARRRISVAVSHATPKRSLNPRFEPLYGYWTNFKKCARCRKRKIRCSGDSGHGTGCSNCKQAGVGPMQWLFYRVGSGEPSRILGEINGNSLANGLTDWPHSDTMISLYDAKASYPPFIHYADEMDAYALEQPSIYLPQQSSSSLASSAYGNYRWGHPRNKPVQSSNTYLDQPIMVYPSHGIPYMPNNMKSATTTEAVSSMNMTALQLSLPERKLPQPSPAQVSRNVVDQLQDQRLRSSQAARSNYSKSVMPSSNNDDAKLTLPTENSSGDLSTQIAVTLEGSLGYLSTTTSENQPSTVQPNFNFSTSNLLDSITASIQPTYSNFRNYHSASSSSEAPSSLTRQQSQTSPYSFSSDSNKRHLMGDTSLVSGRPYTPLSHSLNQTQQPANIQNGRHHDIPLHRNSASILDQGL